MKPAIERIAVQAVNVLTKLNPWHNGSIKATILKFVSDALMLG
jgi:hypothetical protein